MSGVGRLLDGRVVIVTGGGRGLGAVIVRTCAQQGARGAVIDRLTPAEMNQPDGWIAVHADVQDPEASRAAFAKIRETLHQVDVVVANAGVVPPWTTSMDIDPDEWDRVFAVNAKGTMLTIREAVRAMGSRGGSIVAMSSLNGWRGDAHIPAYAASKHAVVGLVRSVALDAGHLGIRVNAVGPGPVTTDALLERMRARSELGGMAVQEALRAAAAATALGRLATQQQVADAVLFLASDLSAGITGHLLPVDAGLL